MTVVGWIVAYLARWFPHPVEPGLRAIGHPGPDAPVLVTANFSLTVKRLTRALAGRDLWLLIVPTGGINVWCAAAGGLFTHQRIIDTIKTSGLAERIDQRTLILPALCAPGVNCTAIEEASGFHAGFGPVRAHDIPTYLDSDRKLTEPMRRFRFDLSHRLEMLLPMNLPVYLVLAAVLALVWPDGLAQATVIFWSAVAVLYTLTPWIPGRTGWTQAMLAASVFVLARAGWDGMSSGEPWQHLDALPGTLGLFLMAGLDLAGIATARKSDPERLLHGLGLRKLGSLYSEKDSGSIVLARERCSGCRMCWKICPVGVYGKPDAERKTTLAGPDRCFNCGACVLQCPEGALSIEAGSGR